MKDYLVILAHFEIWISKGADAVTLGSLIFNSMGRDLLNLKERKQK